MNLYQKNLNKNIKIGNFLKKYEYEEKPLISGFFYIV